MVSVPSFRGAPTRQTGNTISATAAELLKRLAGML